MRRFASVALMCALVASACGGGVAGPEETPTTVTSAPASTSTTATSTTRRSEQVYIADGTVLDKEGVGPQLCTHVRDSLPPQCDGLPVLGLDWAEIPWAETAGDTTWADVRLIGVFNGSELVLTEGPMEPAPIPFEVPDFSTPCPVPDEGWTAHDPALATEQDFQRANEYARTQPEFAGSWVDQLQEPSERVEFAESYLANFAFTADLDRHRVAIEQIYGGPVCVSEGKRPLAELREIQDRLFDQIFSPQAAAAGIYAGFGASGGVDQFKGVVEVSVMAVTGDEAQSWLDEQFGVGTVILHSFLQPYRGPVAPQAEPLFPDQEGLAVGVWVQGTTYDLSRVPASVLFVESVQPPSIARSGTLAVVGDDRSLIYQPIGAAPMKLGSGVDTFAVSVDGSRAAWAEPDQPDTATSFAPTRLLEADLDGGYVVAEYLFEGFDLERRPTIGFARVMTYAGDNVVLSTGDGAAASAGVWAPAGGTVIRSVGYGSTRSSNSADRRVVLNQGDGTCGVIVEVRSDGSVDPPEGGLVKRTLGCWTGQAPTFSPDGWGLAIGGTDGEAGPPIVVLTDLAGTVFNRIPIVGASVAFSRVVDIVWADDVTLLVLVEDWTERSADNPWAGEWGIYQCDLDDTGCHLQQEINFEPTGSNQVGLVELSVPAP